LLPRAFLLLVIKPDLRPLDNIPRRDASFSFLRLGVWRPFQRSTVIQFLSCEQFRHNGAYTWILVVLYLTYNAIKAG
jgi:hypothetical protein